MQLWRKITWALSFISITISFYAANVPVAAKTTKHLELAANRSLTPKEYLYVHARNAAKIDRIIVCESGWKADAKNPTSSATGLGQFLDSTWISTRLRMGLDPDLALRLDPMVHLETLIWLYEHDGERHWLESEPCWTI